MIVPLNTNTRVTAIKNHEGWHHFFRTRPNIGVQVMPLARPVTRGVDHARRVPSVVAFKEAASGTPDAQRWAAEEGQDSFHGGTNQNQPHILYTHTRKRLSEPSEIYRGVNLFTPEYEIACPNRETYSEASIIVHLKSKYPVRTIKKRHQASIIIHARTNAPVRTVRYGHRRQWFYTQE